MKRWLIIAAVATVFLAAVLMTESKWEGDVTESAAAPLAEKAGVQESRILPWKIEGDLLLFFFLAGGAVAGFAAGYYWRALFSLDARKEDTSLVLTPPRAPAASTARPATGKAVTQPELQRDAE